MDGKIRLALQNLISGVSKLDDAPLSASTHFNKAMTLLLEVLPSYEAKGESADILLFAIGEITALENGI